MVERKLNLDFASSISELESLMNKFSLKWIIYQFLFRGKGLEFDGYKSYSPDDDASLIDWMASSRSNEVLVKKYVEERNLKIMFLVDVSDSMVFGSAEKLKCECAAEIIASLAHLITLSGDGVGFCLFNGKVRDVVFPAGGMKRFNVLAQELSSPSNYGGKPANLDEILDFFLDYLDESVNAVFLLSDFLHLGKDFSRNLSIFSQKFETIPIIINDNLDETLPKMDSEIIIEDPSSGEQIFINSLVARREYEKSALQDKQKLLKNFNDAEVDYLQIKTHEGFIGNIVEFLNERARRKKVIMPKG